MTELAFVRGGFRGLNPPYGVCDLPTTSRNRWYTHILRLGFKLRAGFARMRSMHHD